jgi:hypothetical protein
MNIRVTAVFVSISMLSSCENGNGSGNNPIFEKHSPGSKIYMDELTVELASPKASGFTYHFNNYVVMNRKEYIEVEISGPELEAEASVLVRNWQKLEGIRRTKGMGYRGAKLKGLKIDVEEVGGKREFVYEDLDKIVD